MPALRPSCLLAIGLGVAATGCADRRTVETAPVSRAPFEYDEAMAQRTWPRTDAMYANGVVEAGPYYFFNDYDGRARTNVGGTTGGFVADEVAIDAQFAQAEGTTGLVEDDAGRRGSLSRLLDGPVFLANLALLPVRMVQTPPWSTVEARPDLVPPSYHAAPPLPPSTSDTPSAEAEEPVAEEPMPARAIATRPATSRAAAAKPATTPRPSRPATQTVTPRASTALPAPRRPQPPLVLPTRPAASPTASGSGSLTLPSTRPTASEFSK